MGPLVFHPHPFLSGDLVLQVYFLSLLGKECWVPLYPVRPCGRGVQGWPCRVWVHAHMLGCHLVLGDPPARAGHTELLVLSPPGMN